MVNIGIYAGYWSTNIGNLSPILGGVLSRDIDRLIDEKNRLIEFIGSSI